ncbi:MAG: hypothetical protein QW255_04310 [Candidatus Bilamarchaeaceae archaeon]
MVQIFVKSNKSRIVPPLYHRARLLKEEILESIKNRDIDNSSVFNSIKDGIEMYRYRLLKDMVHKSIELQKAEWKYGGNIAFFENNENSQICLLLPKNKGIKYIHARKGDKAIIAAFSFCNYHIEIENILDKFLGQVYVYGGGFIRIKENNPKTLILYGSSVDFGKADHKLVSNILRPVLPTYQIIPKIND